MPEPPGPDLPESGSGTVPDRVPRRILGPFLALVVAAGCVGLAVEAWHGVREVKRQVGTDVRAVGKGLYDWDVCIEKQIHASIPRGAAVVIPDQDPYWGQSLPSLATPWARVVGDERHARFVVSVSESHPDTPRARRCGTPMPGRPYPLNTSVTLVVAPT
jgi:hypothetical protein